MRRITDGDYEGYWTTDYIPESGNKVKVTCQTKQQVQSFIKKQEKKRFDLSRKIMFGSMR